MRLRYRAPRCSRFRSPVIPDAYGPASQLRACALALACALAHSTVTTYSPESEYPASDLLLLDDDDLSPAFPNQLDPTLQRTARLASLDPDDGIQL